MKNKQFWRSILLAILLTPLSASAYDFCVDGIYYSINYNNKSEVSVVYHDDGYAGISSKYAGDVKLPPTVTCNHKTYSVTSIGTRAFYNCEDLTSITIPNTVTSIGVEAFCGCNGLKHIAIPHSVASISDLAFSNCTNLLNLDVENENLVYCSVNGVVFSKDKTTLNIFPAGRKTYTIPESVMSIGGYAFYGCSGLTNVSIPNSVTSIGSNAFSGCSSLTSVTIPESVISIGDYAFSGCSSLTSVTIPSSVTSIAFGSFYECSSLTTVTIPNSVTSIGSSAFSGCSSLTNVTIPESVTSIGLAAFFGCSGLASITIPNSVTSIGDGAFGGCTKLLNIDVENGNLAYCSIDGVVFNVDKTVVCAFPAGRKAYTIPNFVTSIGRNAFWGCSNLTTVTIPNSVASIGISAFRDCNALTSITIPNSVTSIGGKAFEGCSSLSSVVIPNSVTNIERNVFFLCSNLKSIVFLPKKLDSLGEIIAGVATGNVQLVYAYGYENSDQIVVDLNDVECCESSLVYAGKFSSCFDGYTRFQFNEYGDASQVTVTDAEGNKISPLASGDYTIANGSTAKISYTVKDGEQYKSVSYTINPPTKTPKVILSLSPRQTTVTAVVSIETDETCIPESVSVGGETAKYGEPIIITGLLPETEYSYTATVTTNLGNFSSEQVSIGTSNVNPRVIFDEIGVTSIRMRGRWHEDGITVTSCGFSRTMNENDFDNIQDTTYRKLEPDTDYDDFYFGVAIEEGGGIYWSWRNLVRTAALTWETGTATATSKTSARLMAGTNCDAESGTGFEWRRIDAPDIIPSTTVACPVVDGMVVGVLRNLDPSAYYKYRPFYTSASGKTYYGEWVGFYTADADVYFEPEVRTYADVAVAENSATVRGYALAGTDDITEQGFEYRRTGSASQSNRRGVAGEWQSVTASGIVMSATFSDLEYGSTYRYRAYATTEWGTVYGEEVEFTTEEFDGIEEAAIETAEELQVTLRENPVSGSTAWLKVASASAANVDCRLTSINGSTIAISTVEADGQWQPLEIKAAPGLYLLTISDNRTLKTLRLIVR